MCLSQCFSSLSTLPVNPQRKDVYMGKLIWKTSSSWTLQQNGSSKRYSDKLVPTIEPCWMLDCSKFSPLCPGKNTSSPMAILKCMKPFWGKSVWIFFFYLVKQPHCQTRKKENYVLGCADFSIFFHLALCYIFEFWASGTVSLKYQTVVQVKENLFYFQKTLSSLESWQTTVVLWWKYTVSPSLSKHLILNILW